MLPTEITRSPYHFPIRRPVTVTMIVLTAVVFGFLSYRLLPINLMPEITYPSLTVRTEYPGAAPEEVESAVTRPIEQTLGVVRNLVEMSSSSRAEVSDVLLEFEWGTDMNRATQEVREKLDVVFLSEDVKQPLILRYDPSLDPMIRIGLTSDSLDLLQLRTFADETIKRELEKVSGVAAVKVKGGEEAEIRVEVDAVRLDLLNLTMERIQQRLASENINIAGGRLREGETEFIVRTLNEFQDVEEIVNIVVDVRDGENIRLKDIARVSRRAGEKTEITRVGGLESVEIEIHKESDANPITVSELLKKRLFGIKPKEKKPAKKEVDEEFSRRRGPIPLVEVLTERIRIHILVNQAEFIQKSIMHVRSAAIIGGILAVIVLLFFLGRLLDTLVVAVVIPVSLVCAFAAMHLVGVSINVMSLGGLALGIGMMVDNAIVVIESIHRRRESSDELIPAAVVGTRIVGGAVTASTLTTIVVFFPIVFVKGIAGQVFGDMALTVIIALSASLLVALFFIPMLVTRGGVSSGGTSTSGWAKPSIRIADSWLEFKRDFNVWRKMKSWSRFFLAIFVLLYLVIRLILFFAGRLFFLLTYVLMFGFRWLYSRLLKPVSGGIATPSKTIGIAFRNGVERLTDFYVRVLKVLLNYSAVILLVVLTLCLVSYLVLLPKLGGELIPSFSQGTFNLELTLPVGTPLEQTAEIVNPIERKLTQMTGVKKVSSRIGGDILSTESSVRGSNSAVITVMLESGGDLDRREKQIVEEVRQLTRDVPALELLITHPTLFTFKQPVEIIIKGNDLEEVRRRGLEVEARLSELPMLADVESTVRPGHPEVVMRFDRDYLARLGLSARDAAERVRSAVLGKVPTRYREEEQRIDIRVQMDEDDRESINQLKRLVVNPGQPIPVTFADVAVFEILEGPSEIKRVGGVRSAVVTADIRDTDLKSADAAIRSEIQQMNMIEGYDYILSGQHREMEDSLASLQFALLLAVFLVYVVMASQFESLKHPLLILITIPLAGACVIPMLWGISMPLSVMVFLGLIVLAGIVVNDSIILVDYTNQLLKSGMQVREAVLEAARARLRPIIMTTLTTVLALLPMALGVGEGVEIRRPMAVTVIFGLSFATLITLVVIPLLYNLVTKGHSESSE